MAKMEIIYIVLFSAVLTGNLANGQDRMPADSFLKLAEEYKSKSNPDSAIYYYAQAAKENEIIGNREGEIDAYNQIGVLLTRQDNYDEAKAWLNKALAKGLASLDSNSLTLARTYISLGVVYSAEDQFDQSLYYHNKALSIRLFKLGKNNADVATSYGNIGNVYFRMKDYDNAIEAHTEAMRIREKLYSKKGFEVIQSYTNLGNAYKGKEDYKNSLGYYKRALQSKIIQLGQDHKDLSGYYTRISEVYYLMHNDRKGAEYKAKAAGVSG